MSCYWLSSVPLHTKVTHFWSMPQEVTHYLTRLIVCILVISVGLAIFNRKRLPGAFKMLGLYLGWNLFIELITFIPVRGTNNLPLLHLYTLVEFVLFTLLYKRMELFKSWINSTFWIYLISISILIILNSIFIQSIFAYNSYAKALVQVLLIVYAVGYMFKLKEPGVESGALNLMNAAILLFYSGSLFVFMFGNILESEQYGALFWDLNVLLNLLFQVLMLISLWKASRIRKLQF